MKPFTSNVNTLFIVVSDPVSVWADNCHGDVVLPTFVSGKPVADLDALLHREGAPCDERRAVERLCERFEGVKCLWCVVKAR